MAVGSICLLDGTGVGAAGTIDGIKLGVLDKEGDVDGADDGDNDSSLLSEVLGIGDGRLLGLEVLALFVGALLDSLEGFLVTVDSSVFDGAFEGDSDDSGDGSADGDFDISGP